MAGGGSKSNPAKARKRVEATEPTAASLVRAKDGSAFARCDECNKDVPVALISFHSCSLDAKIKMNLEAKVLEKPAEVKKKPAERKKSTSEPKLKKAKIEKVKKGKDPNKPKRPPTAFFIFMDDFRKSYKEANPDAKGVKQVAKEGGEKWKSMTDEEKKPYLDKAAELKVEYEKTIEALNADNNGEEEEASGHEAADGEAAEGEAEEKENLEDEELSDPE